MVRIPKYIICDEKRFWDDFLDKKFQGKYFSFSMTFEREEKTHLWTDLKENKSRLKKEYNKLKEDIESEINQYTFRTHNSEVAEKIPKILYLDMTKQGWALKKTDIILIDIKNVYKVSTNDANIYITEKAKSSLQEIINRPELAEFFKSTLQVEDEKPTITQYFKKKRYVRETSHVWI